MQKLNNSLALLSAIILMLSASGCAGSGQSCTAENSSAESVSSAEDTQDSESESSAETSETKQSAQISKADANTAWDENAVKLTFDGDSVSASAEDGLQIDGSAVTITKGGDYVLSGTLDDGQVTVDLTDKTEKAHLIFNGVKISSSSGSALSVLQADKTVITLADGTENTLSDAKTYAKANDTSDESAISACLASKDDLSINGTGTLNINGNTNNGIHCKDDLKIVGGNINVTAVNHGIRGNDLVLIHDGNLTVEAGGDGIKSSTTDTEGKGAVYIEGGTVTVQADSDGIDAATDLIVTDGTLDITAGGGAANASSAGKGNDDFGGFMPGGSGGQQGGFGKGGMGRGRNFGQQDDSAQDGQFGWGGGFTPDGGQMQSPNGFDMPDDMQLPDNMQGGSTESNTESSGTSAKALKAAGTLTLSGGTLTLDSADDGLHADDTVSVSGSATVTIQSGDDGIHADSAVTVSGGCVDISQSYEGIESAEITISGGTVHVRSSDDGLNASDGSGGGMGFNRNGSGELKISGGYLFVNADGDGLDSNGNITMTGGTAVVCGPTNDGDGPLDAGDNNNTISVTGGTLLAVGSTGMMDVPESNYLATTELNAEAGTWVVVTDEDDNVLAALKTPKKAQGAIVSVDSMSDGYRIYTGGTLDGKVNADDFADASAYCTYSGGTLIASGNGGGGNGFGRFGGGFGGGRGDRRSEDLAQDEAV